MRPARSAYRCDAPWVQKTADRLGPGFTLRDPAARGSKISDVPFSFPTLNERVEAMVALIARDFAPDAPLRYDEREAHEYEEWFGEAAETYFRRYSSLRDW